MPGVVSNKSLQILIFRALHVSMFVALAGCTESPPPTPDLSGLWAREFIGFEPPDSGQGPIGNLSRLPTGQSNLDLLVGDYSNPILKPAAAAVLKERGEISLSGTPFPDPGNQCWPQPMPYILWQFEFQLLQQDDQVTILYMHDHQVRRVRLSAEHPSKVKPSWSGDSIGWYEGDTLVIDTVGVKVGPYSMADFLGTPQSEAVHVVERYRLIDHEAAQEAAKQAEKEHVHIPGDLAVADGVAVDPDYKGKALQIQFTVEDPNILRAPWSATSTYSKALSPWAEYVCAENPHRDFGGLSTDIPTADVPDF